MTRIEQDSRVKSIAGGAVILAGIAASVCGTLAGWRHVPGLLGEWLGMMVGVMTTPFLLEMSFVIIGLTVVLALNGWRQRHADDEWVDLEASQFLPCTAPVNRSSMLPMNEDLVPMNLEHFTKMAYGDVPWLRGLAIDFFHETRALLPQWATMIEAGRFEELRAELHRCKGGSSLFGFERVVAMLAIFERPVDLETHGFNVAAFEQELAAAERAVDAMVEPAA